MYVRRANQSLYYSTLPLDILDSFVLIVGDLHSWLCLIKISINLKTDSLQVLLEFKEYYSTIIFLPISDTKL